MTGVGFSKTTKCLLKVVNRCLASRTATEMPLKIRCRPDEGSVPPAVLPGSGPATFYLMHDYSGTDPENLKEGVRGKFATIHHLNAPI